MTEPNQYYAYFTVTGDFDPTEVTSLMDVAPTEAWIKGSRNERTRFERKFSRWSLFSRLPKSAPIETHIQDVVEQLQPHAAAVYSLESDSILRFQSSHTSTRAIPACTFTLDYFAN